MEDLEKMVSPPAIQPHSANRTVVEAPPVAKPAANATTIASQLQLTDSVQISAAAQVALKEAMETQAQTIREATSGDHQAQRLLAKELAERNAE